MPPILLAVDKTYPKGLMWFRRDLRVDDNAALYRALRACRQVVCVFVFDKAILDGLPGADRRVEFIRESLVELEAELRGLGGGLIVRHAMAVHEVPGLARRLGVQAVFANHDDEPAALARDAQVRGGLADQGIALHDSKDHVVFEREELLTQSGTPYSVFTPYKRAWLAKADAFYLRSYPVDRHAAVLAPRPEGLRQPVPTLQEIGFERTNLSELAIPIGAEGGSHLLDDFLHRIDRYADTRDYPAIKGPSYLSDPPAFRHRVDTRAWRDKCA
jgi:deoxyribodipyrimidine photo-lyase